MKVTLHSELEVACNFKYDFDRS